MPTILVQTYRFHPEEAMLRQLAAQFLRNGYRMVLWSNREHGTAGLPMIPLNWGPAEDELFVSRDYPSHSSPRYTAWEAHEKFLEDHYGESHPAFETSRCHRIARTVFDAVRPSLLLVWCGMNPCFSVPRAVAREMGIPVLVWEAGYLPETFLLDSGGICGESQWCGQESPSTSPEWLNRAEEHIGMLRTSTLKAAGLPRPEPPGGRTPTILVLGGMDMANGVHRPKDEGASTLPGFKDGIDLAQAAHKAWPQGTVIYRPHPREPKLPLRRLEGGPIKIDATTKLEAALVAADVIIGYGSKTDFVAMSLGKPFIMAGNGLVVGKGCAYEALDERSLRPAIEAAIRHELREKQSAAFRNLVAWLLADGHYNRIPAGGICRKSVRELATDALAHADTKARGGDFRDALSVAGRQWWTASTVRFRFNKRFLAGPNPEERVKQQVASINGVQPILDFDHTLWLANSTEQFIGQASPRALGEAVDNFSRRVWDRFGHKTPLERDQFRVIAISLATPWSWITWHWDASSNVKTYWNASLFNSVTSVSTSPPIVVSFGFAPIIRPLLNTWGGTRSRAGVPVLVASGLWGRSASLRTKGKVAAVNSVCSKFDWTKAVSVSDSEEDAELLGRSRKATLTRWPEPAQHNVPGYLPFRYIGQGKYPGFGYLKDYILSQDLVVWMILLAATGSSVIPAFLLFLSFQAIYEIGYYENDFLAAAREKSPNLSDKYRRFAKYPIVFWAWAWACATGAAGCFLAESAWSNRSAAAWLAILLAVRLCFGAYNRLQPDKRIPFYIALQWLKNFGGTAILAPSPAGMVLAIAHWFQHTSVYMIYRCGGDKTRFKRAQARACVYILGLGALWLLGQPLTTMAAMLGLAWVLQQAAAERLGIRETPWQFAVAVARYSVRFLRRIVK